MVKRKKIEPDPDPEPEELNDEDEELEPEEQETPEEGGLTYKMRYTVGMHNPEQSEKGTKCFGLFFETEKLVEAKREAEKAFKEDNLEVVIWDRDKWSSDAGCEVARYVPETEVKGDEDGEFGGDTIGIGATIHTSKASKSREPKAKGNRGPKARNGSPSTARGGSSAKRKKSAKSSHVPDRTSKKKIPPSKRKKSKRKR